MTANEKFKDIYENAYLQQKQTIELNYNQYKNMIETAYLQHIQIIKTNASIMKTYYSMFGNSEVAKNIEKMESDFLTLNEESKKSMIRYKKRIQKKKGKLIMNKYQIIIEMKMMMMRIIIKKN